MVDHVSNRRKIMKILREELVGPSPQGDELDCSGPVIFEDITKFRLPWKQKDTREEILQRDRPLKRYGIGVLYPLGTLDETEETVQLTDASISITEPKTEKEPVAEELLTPRDKEDIAKIGGGDTDPYDFDLTSANTYRPSSIGISFLAEFPPDSSLVVEVPSYDSVHEIGVNGRYARKKAQVEGKEWDWWLRSSIKLKAVFDGNTICMTDGKIAATSLESENVDGLDLRIEVFSRPHETLQTRLMTVCLVNRLPDKDPTDQYCLFQTFFSCRCYFSG